jgi:CubicO group peptidase (beta-lactamase class C family)
MATFSATRRRLLLSGSALVLTSCGGGMVQPSASQPLPQQLSAALAQLDGIAESALARSGVPGMAVVVVYQDRVVHLKGYGVRKAGSPDRVDGDTVFQLASVSKPIASTVMAGLVGDGLIQWDDPVVQHDPTFSLSDPAVTPAVTLRDLFCHRSGLRDHAGDLAEDIGYKREEVLYRLRFLPLGKRFRNTYAYTNFGLTEAAVAAARAAGMSWEELADRRLFQPAGMHATSPRHADFVASANRAALHVKVSGEYVARFDRNPDAQSPAGGVSSSARDMARWLRLQLNDGKLDGVQLIAAAPLRETREPQVESEPASQSPAGRASYYGLGWGANSDAAGRPRNSHSGAFALGASTIVQIVPDQGLGIVVLTNAWPVGVPEAITATFMDLALDGAVSQDWFALYGQGITAIQEAEFRGPTDYSHPPASPQPARAATAYVGRYENSYYGALSVVAQGGGLVLLLGPEQIPYPLQHWDGDRYVYRPSGENAVEVSGVIFSMGSQGQAERVRIEYLDQKEEGDFARAGSAGGGA